MKLFRTLFFFFLTQALGTETFSMSDVALLIEQNGIYLAEDTYGTPRFIIKPNSAHTKENIPPYQSTVKDALCYEIASLSGLASITPKTDLITLSLPQKPGETLCSIQEYVENSIPLYQLLQQFFAIHLTEEEIALYFDEEDFALINLFAWLTFDNDAHAGNILAYPKKISPTGLTTYGLKKIDNSLSLPEKNTGFFLFLMHFPYAFVPVTESIKDLIRNLPLPSLETSFVSFGLDQSLLAFKERVFVLQKLIEHPLITYYEIGLRLVCLNDADGVQIALSPLSLEELQKLAPSFL